MIMIVRLKPHPRYAKLADISMSILVYNKQDELFFGYVLFQRLNEYDIIVGRVKTFYRASGIWLASYILCAQSISRLSI